MAFLFPIASFLMIKPERFATAADLIVPPFVQLGDRVANGENSVAILWQVKDGDAPYALNFVQDGKKFTTKTTFTTVKVDGIEPHRVYSAVLKGYKPGAPINYTLESGRNILFKGNFNAPKSDKQDYTFAVFGDCGCDSPAQAAIAYQTYKAKPDMLMLTGDLVYGRGLASEYRKNFWPMYTPEVASPKDGAPILSSMLMVAAPGNHDILHRELDQTPDALAFFYYWNQPLNGPLTDIGNPSTPTLTGSKEHQEAFLAAAGKNYPRSANFSFDYGNAHIVALDADPYVKWGTDEKLRSWLRDDLAKNQNKTWRFVIFHQPGFHSSDSHQGEKQMRQVADIFEEGKVDVVFAGHVHNYQRSFPIQVGSKKGASKEELALNDWPVDKSFDGAKNTKPKGVIYIVSGAGGNSLYNPELNGHPELWKPFQATYFANFSFSMVDVKGKTFSMKQLDREGKVLDTLTITK